MFNISVMSISGSILRINCNDGTTICNIRDEVGTRIGVPIDSVQLTFQGRQIAERDLNNKAVDMNIEQGSTLMYLMRLKGG